MSSVEAPFKYLVKMFESGYVGDAEGGVSSADISLHERLFQQLNDLYNHPKNGLISIGEKIDVEILPPKKKVTILLIGNHSAGKSSFINWYIEDNVQRTGMAIETQSFTVIASGRKRETLMGPATVFLFPHLKPLERIEGVMDYLNAEISTSKKRQFSMITFIDTPGLVDGGMEYPFNVNDAILFLGGVADLIFVFFDPIGLALCKRTMTVVEKINLLYPEKLHFYLSKSDEIRKQTEKQKIMMQITQEVCRHAGLNRSGFSMPSIYIPTLVRNHHTQKPPSNSSTSIDRAGQLQTGECYNEIEEVCTQIEQKISRTLQTTLSNYERDINTLLEAITVKLTTNKEISDQNWTFMMFSSVGVILLLGLIVSAILKYLIEHYGVDYLTRKLPIEPDIIQLFTVPVRLIPFSTTDHVNYMYVGYLIILLSVLLSVYYKTFIKPTLPRREIKELERLKVFITNYLIKKKVELTQEYLGESYDL